MRPPVPLGNVPAGGRYGAVRSGGVTHWGLDIPAKAGAPVVAPEDLTVTHVGLDNVTAPLAGYGPASVLGQGASGRWHVLGHLALWPAGTAPRPGDVYPEGSQLGTVGAIKGPHCHWEIRTVELPPRGAARGPLTLDPVAWLGGRLSPVPGRVGGMGALVALALIYLLMEADRA